MIVTVLVISGLIVSAVCIQVYGMVIQHSVRKRTARYEHDVKGKGSVESVVLNARTGQKQLKADASFKMKG